MKQLLKLMALAGCLVLNDAYGQNAYHNIENFKAGTTLLFQACKTDNVEAGKSGEHITWDFSDLKHAAETKTEWIVTPDSIDEAKDYPKATLVEKYTDGSLVFLQTDVHKTYLLGFANNKSKIRISYPEPVLIASRPFSYSEKVTEPYTTSYSVNGLNFSGKGSTTLEADGFGTLVLPNGRFENTLRIKITQQQTDVLKQYNSTSETTITTYVWFDQTHRSALLKMTETASPYHREKSIEYLISEVVK